MSRQIISGISFSIARSFGKFWWLNEEKITRLMGLKLVSWSETSRIWWTSLQNNNNNNKKGSSVNRPVVLGLGRNRIIQFHGWKPMMNEGFLGNSDDQSRTERIDMNGSEAGVLQYEARRTFSQFYKQEKYKFWCRKIVSGQHLCCWMPPFSTSTEQEKTIDHTIGPNN